MKIDWKRLLKAIGITILGGTVYMFVAVGAVFGITWMSQNAQELLIVLTVGICIVIAYNILGDK